eukprot:GDKJ01035666.1.p2 GENE.GDKJ01035666.1~~GDKJ01035666.1.p2  ORF type:complete len:158 (+),score=54.15 GDKJ01035666.1:1-474(+)
MGIGTKSVLQMAERVNGIVKWFDVKKGYGFITPDDGSEDLFVHHSALKCEGFRSVKVESKVEFEKTIDDRGKPKAVNVTGPNGDFCEPSPPPERSFDNERRGGFGGDRRGGFGGRGRGGFGGDRPRRDFGDREGGRDGGYQRREFNDRSGERSERFD